MLPKRRSNRQRQKRPKNAGIRIGVSANNPWFPENRTFPNTGAFQFHRRREYGPTANGVPNTICLVINVGIKPARHPKAASGHPRSVFCREFRVLEGVCQAPVDAEAASQAGASRKTELR